MPLKFGSTTIENVYWEEYSGGVALYMPIEKIIFNGTTVFQKISKKTITETLNYTFGVVSSSSGATFYYPKPSIALQHTPMKVTKISGINGSSSNGTVDSSGLKGTLTVNGSVGRTSSSRTLSWSVSGNSLTWDSRDSLQGTKTPCTISITYEYMG